MPSCVQAPDAPAEAHRLRAEERIVAGVCFHVEHGSLPEPSLEMFRAALDRATPIALRFGTPKEKVKISIYESPISLQQSIRKTHLPWLRAWATDRGLTIVAPKDSRSSTAVDRYTRLLAHELVHVFHYRLAGIPAAVSTTNDPFWFREGLAVVTAGEQGDYPGARELAQVYRRDPDFSLVELQGPPSNTEARRAYGAAAVLCGELLKRFGDASVRDLFGRLRQGDPSNPQLFRRSFQAVFGRTEVAWEQEVRERLLVEYP